MQNHCNIIQHTHAKGNSQPNQLSNQGVLSQPKQLRWKQALLSQPILSSGLIFSLNCRLWDGKLQAHAGHRSQCQPREHTKPARLQLQQPRMEQLSTNSLTFQRPLEISHASLAGVKELVGTIGEPQQTS